MNAKTTTLWKLTAVLAAALLASPVAFAAQQLTFEGLTAVPSRDDVQVSDFYNSGWSRNPTTGAPVQLGSMAGYTANPDALVTEAAEVGGQSSVFGQNRLLVMEDGTQRWSTELGSGTLYSRTGFLHLQSAGGFTDAISFFYTADSNLTIYVVGSANNMLALGEYQFAGLSLCPSVQSRCQWNAASLSFAGTATDVYISAVGADFGIDNLTFGSANPSTLTPTGPITPVPEAPSYLMWLIGLCGVALSRRNIAR